MLLEYLLGHLPLRKLPVFQNMLALGLTSGRFLLRALRFYFRLSRLSVDVSAMNRFQNSPMLTILLTYQFRISGSEDSARNLKNAFSRFRKYRLTYWSCVVPLTEISRQGGICQDRCFSHMRARMLNRQGVSRATSQVLVSGFGGMIVGLLADEAGRSKFGKASNLLMP